MKVKTTYSLMFSVAILSACCFAGQTNSVPQVVHIEGRQTNLFPVIGTVYLISGSDLYKQPENPGPGSKELSIAWQIANEFVFRTALQAKYNLPAGSSRLLANHDALVGFTPKQGGKELAVLVHWNKRKVEIAKP
jgi:hypothetical protein